MKAVLTAIGLALTFWMVFATGKNSGYLDGYANASVYYEAKMRLLGCNANNGASGSHQPANEPTESDHGSSYGLRYMPDSEGDTARMTAAYHEQYQYRTR